MAIVKTLAEVQRTVEYCADVRGKVGTGSTFRHTTEDLYPEINSAYVELLEELVERGFNFSVQEGSLTALPTARADTDENYSVIDWPLDYQAIVRVDVKINQQWATLDRVQWENLRGVLPVGVSSSSTFPTHYAVREYARVATDTEVAGKIALAPFHSSGQYKLSFLPRWTDVTDTTHEFIFPSESAFRWTVWNVVGRIAIRDRNTAKRYDMSIRERDMAAKKIGRYTSKVTPQRGGTMRRAARRFG